MQQMRAAYLDSSVLLRLVLRQPGVVKEWKTIQRAVASAFVEVECLQTRGGHTWPGGHSIPRALISFRR